ncbi:Outer membrane protein TolC [Desulfuromusa kysingii]|uniref:Outer membrane protein TolC n=1 Tax=Desulfuromusa kysingii TaxID=37625 RepID=A0A1H4AZ36_9BACT|nr:TolC family protein [Desulfuromusa kysingii]SEA41058.1 Outer membrane protein TolC [Desulfuromusa kysingii]
MNIATTSRWPISLMILLLLGWTGWAYASSTAVQHLSFDAAWQAALSQTPEMLMSRAQIAEAQGAVTAASGQLLPKLQASYSASGSDSGLNVFGMKLNQGQASFNDFGASLFDPTDPSSLYITPGNLNNPSWYSNYQTKLELLVPVFNGGKIRGYLQQARAYLSAAHNGNEMARQQLMLEVLKAYQGVHTAVALVAVAEKAVTAAESYTELTNKLFARGVVARNDQLRAQLNLSNVCLRRSEVKTYLGKIYDQLRVLVGNEDDRPINVTETLQVSLPEESLADLRQHMLLDNPGLRALGEKVVAGQAEVKIARADYLPSFNLLLSSEWNNPDFEPGGNHSSMVAGVLSWNLFDFGSRRGQVNQANARLSQQRAHLNQARNQLRLQLESAWRDVALAAERVKVRELAISQAEEAERLERLRYEKGVATMTELLAAQAELDKSRSELVAANYQQIMQRAGLLLALGRLTPAAVSHTKLMQ